MKKKNLFYSSIFIVFFLVTLIALYWFVKSPFYLPTHQWIQTNKTLYLFILLLIKISGIVWPPITSGIFTMGSIPFLGWPLAYAVDLAGSLIGGAIAYKLGKKYGVELLSNLFDKSIIEKIKKVKIKKGKEIEGVFVYRVLLGTTILEAVYYGAGLLEIKFWKFMIGAFLSHLVVGIPTFILAQNIFGGKNLIITGVSIILSIILVLKTKGRYFE